MKLGKSQRDKSDVEVASIAVIRDGALLWLRRADCALWTLPGGHLNPGEEPLDGALRELREETGLTPPESDVEFLGDDLVPGKAHLRIYCFVVEVPPGTMVELSQDPDQEASDYEWKDELPESDHCYVSHGDNVTLKFLLENDELSKAEQKEWRAKDGLKIPHHTTPARAEWDKAYHKKLVEFFGAGDSQRLKPVKIPITPQTSGTNPVVSKARFSLYTRMLAGGDRLPPAVVRRNGIGWHVVDGNHRLEAALKRGLKEMDAYELVDPPKKTKKSEEPLTKAEGPVDLVAATTESLDNSLRRPQYRSSPNPLAGHCYVASEALWHMMGGHESGWVPQNVKHEGDQHWYLRHAKTGQILDPTASQFRTPVPYDQGRGRGFLTKQPSKRAQEVINRVQAKLGKAEDLTKGLFSTAALAGAMALGQVGGAEPDPKPAKALVEATQRAGIAAEPVKWSALGLHQALIPIAHLESSFGQNIAHAKHPKGDYHTAHGALGFKPVTAHEEYLRAPTLQKLYGDMKDPAVFINKFKTDPKFYNLLATSHFMRLQKQHGSVERAAYAWRWGTGACQGASDEQVATEPYVMRYRSLAANAGLKKMAIKDIKPGTPIDETTYDYTHLIKSPALRRNYVMHVTHDPSAGQKPTDPNAREPRSIARVTIKHKQSGQLVGYVDGSWDRTESGHKAILPTYSVLRDKALRGKGLGKAMYEALYAHANTHLGIKHAVGEEHSTSASRVHQALAEKHGWDYQPQWGARDQTVSRDFDGAFGPYEYKLT